MTAKMVVVVVVVVLLLVVVTVRKRHDETTDHIISTCPILAKEEHIKRHDSVCPTTL
jgi:hypothetical protein